MSSLPGLQWQAIEPRATTNNTARDMEEEHQRKQSLNPSSNSGIMTSFQNQVPTDNDNDNHNNHDNTTRQPVMFAPPSNLNTALAKRMEEQQSLKPSDSGIIAAFQNQVPSDSGRTQPVMFAPTNLRLYQTTPASERSAQLERWICEQLEDDAFVELCRDVEGVWKRMALGQ